MLSSSIFQFTAQHSDQVIFRYLLGSVLCFHWFMETRGFSTPITWTRLLCLNLAAESAALLTVYRTPTSSRALSHPAGWSKENKICSESLMYHICLLTDRNKRKVLKKCVSEHFVDERWQKNLSCRKQTQWRV